MTVRGIVLEASPASTATHTSTPPSSSEVVYDSDVNPTVTPVANGGITSEMQGKFHLQLGST